MTTISKSRFKARALELFREVEKTGVPIVITDRGRPVLRLEAIAAKGELALEQFRGCVLAYEEPLEPVGAEDWEALGPAAETK